MNKEMQTIIDLFNKNVKGKKADLSNSNLKHDGSKGHWVEKQMGISRNSKNEADLLGHEMKDKTSSGKISFGDWSADEYIFFNAKKSNTNALNESYNLTRKDFMLIFGKKNLEKRSRYSWSGEPCPTYYGRISNYGQLLTSDSDNNIIITYSYSKDQRKDKNIIVPIELQKENLVIARWLYNSIKSKLERKFNQKGWFTFSTNSNDEYEKIHFGEAMNYTSWFKLLQSGKVFFDSGMYHDDDKKNIRPYSQFRATTGFWHSLIIDTF
jgi:mRNA-degrading endonuclease RelE of RelBE toxin-antitoxin system